MSKFSTLKMVDRAENYRVPKGDFFDLPLRLLIIGKSQLSGKTNCLGNLLLRPYDSNDTAGKNCYLHDFPGRNIYIICPSTSYDSKWQTIINTKQIPDTNIYNGYDEEEVNALYDRLAKDFQNSVDAGRKPEHTLVIMDDISWNGDLKSKIHGAVSKFACNGRHLLISTIMLSQKYTDVLTTVRENCTGMILFACSNKQAELIYSDVGMTDKKVFMQCFRKATAVPHSFMVVNFSNPHDRRFMDCTFNPIEELCGY